MVLAGLVAGTFLIESGFRFWSWARGVDHRIYLQELTRSGTLTADIWKPSDGPAAETVERAYRSYPPLRPNHQIVSTTADYSVVYTINGKGLRDREYSYQKPAGVRRVLVFGDSFTFGSGVTQDQCFTEMAETALPGVEILNMGVPGYGLDQILLSFIAQGELYQPDLVVVFLNSHITGRNRLGIVEGNTVHVPDTLETVEFEGESGGTVYLRADDPLVTSGRSWLVRHSHALSFLTYRLQVRRLQKQLEAEDERFWRKSIRFNQGAPLREDILPERRQRTIVLLRELMRRVASVGAGLLVVNIDRNVAVSFLRSEPGLDLVDLSRELTARAKTAPLTFTYDQHYNADTHRFLGERLAAELRRRLEKR